MSNYKPTEHYGLREDGQPDHRVGTGEFAQGRVDPHEAGRHHGGSISGQDSGDSFGGSSKGEFAHGKVDPHEAGRLGGSVGSHARGESFSGSSKGEFAHGKVDPHEAGRLGGLK